MGQRVLDLEEAQAATTHFHMAKPDLDDSFASISVDISPHTKPRDPIPIQITPEKEDGIDPIFAEEMNQQIAEGQKQLESMFASPLKIPPKEAVKEKATTDPFNPSPQQKKLKSSVAAEVRQRFEARKAKCDNQYAELNSNLGFI